MNKERLSAWFRNFAEKECKGSSKLYEHLSHQIAKDDEVLAVSSMAMEGQPVPNLLFGAVHFLLLKNADHPLREYYPSLTDVPLNVKDSFPHFKDFCLENRDAVISILETRRVQTNEVRRTAYLYPSFCHVYDIAKKPLSLIEIGTSAGLQLLWDQYKYSYGDNEVCGNPSSPVHIESEIKGGRKPVFQKNSPPVASRTGLDLHVCDLTDPDTALWLKALIWPEHKERLQLFEQAADYFIQQPAKLMEGDGIALLREVIRDIPLDQAVCIFHTHVANQIPEHVKVQLMDTFKEIGRQRDVFHLYNNMWDGKLHLDYMLDGVLYENIIGETDGHARWFTWEL